MKFARLLLPLLLATPPALFAQGAANPATDSARSDYRIAPRDSIQFQVYNQPDMTTVQRVTSTGEVRLPLIGTVKVAGTTLREAEVLLETLYRTDGYFVEPQVIISVQQYGDRFVAVLGQVKEPARIPLAAEDGSIGILQAITQAGGFTRVARTDAVQVLRTSAKGSDDERLIINMDDILHPKTAAKAQEFQLRPGDIVFVPERVF